MIRFHRDRIDRLPDAIRRPGHPLPMQTGIVHFGPGAFHRAHQASYIDALLDHDPRWGIAAASLRTRETVAALAIQGGAYTIGVRDDPSEWRVVAAHNRFLAPEHAAQTHALLASADVALVTTTVTEKGYCLAPDGALDLAHPDVAHDLAGAATPRSVVGWIVAGLAARRAAGIAPFTPMPCDNLAGNGAKLHAALVAFARIRAASLADWIASEVRVPAAMVDSITPASSEAFLAEAAAAIGARDAAAVQRESFVQWVIEDIGRPIGPDLASVGAIVTNDVAGYERAKLRLLNGAHSTLAYGGLLRGHSSVAAAMRDPLLARFVETMMRVEIAPLLQPVPGLDLDNYIDAILRRFANPTIVHRLDQIAQDGSQKLPYRLIDSLIEARRTGAPRAGLLAAIGMWVAFLMRRARDGAAIVDPAGETLAAMAQDGDGRAVIERIAGAGLVLPGDLAADPAIASPIGHAADKALAGDFAHIGAGG